MEFDERSRRYRDPETGRFVSKETVRRAAMDAEERFKAEASKHASRLETGAISAAVFTTAMALLVKSNLVVMSAIGKGGWRQMSRSDWGSVGAAVKREYGYLRKFAGQLDRLSAPQINARARMYANAGYVAFSGFLTRTFAVGAYTQARRTLHAAESCSGCESFAGEWMPIGELPEIGTQECGSRCKCSVDYR